GHDRHCGRHAAEQLSRFDAARDLAWLVVLGVHTAAGHEYDRGVCRGRDGDDQLSAALLVARPCGCAMTVKRATYELWLADPFGNRIKLLRRWTKIAGFRKANTVGQLRLTVARSEIGAAYLMRDARLEVWRDGRLLLDAIWLLRGVKRATMKGGRRMLELLFFDQLDLLDGAIVAYPAGSAQAVKTGPADDLIKAYARENIGYLATDPDRNLSDYITITANDGRAPIVYKTAPRR